MSRAVISAACTPNWARSSLAENFVRFIRPAGGEKGGPTELRDRCIINAVERHPMIPSAEQVLVPTDFPDKLRNH